MKMKEGLSLLLSLAHSHTHIQQKRIPKESGMSLITKYWEIFKGLNFTNQWSLYHYMYIHMPKISQPNSS